MVEMAALFGAQGCGASITTDGLGQYKCTGSITNLPLERRDITETLLKAALNT